MTDLDFENLARRYLAGEPLYQLSKAFRASPITVKEMLAARGIGIRSRTESLRERKAKAKAIDVADVVRRYVNGEPAEVIGRSVGVAGCTIRAWLEARGVEVRSEAASYKLKRMPTDDAEIVRRYRGRRIRAGYLRCFGTGSVYRQDKAR